MIVLIVMCVALVTGLALVGARALVTDAEALDVERSERWLVRHAPAWMRRPLRALDRRFVGGVAVVVVFVAVFGCALVVGWIFSTVDDGTGFARWDEAAAEWGAEHATETSTDVLDVLTDLGGTAYLLVAMALIGMHHGLRRRDWGPLVYLAVVGVGVTLLNNLLKWIVDRDRPDIAQLTGHVGSSFPSGHSAAAAACWAAIALVLARRWSAGGRAVAAFVAVVLAGAVAATRVLLGVHWLTDVVAGVVVGWTWFFAVTVVFGGRLLRLGEPAERIATRQPAASERAQEVA